MTSDEKIVKLLEMQEKGFSINEICKELGLSSSGALSNLANRKGYRFDKGLKKYVKKDNTVKTTDKEYEKEVEDRSNTRSNTICNSYDDFNSSSLRDSKSNKRSNTISNTDAITNNSVNYNTTSNTYSNTESERMIPVDLMDLWSNEKGTIEDMVRWYKKLKEETKTDIFIDLPKAANVMVSTRSNKVIWEAFGVFAEKYKQNFSKGDLLAEALREFMEKYR